MLQRPYCSACGCSQGVFCLVVAVALLRRVCWCSPKLFQRPCCAFWFFQDLVLRRAVPEAFLLCFQGLVVRLQVASFRRFLFLESCFALDWLQLPGQFRRGAFSLSPGASPGVIPQFSPIVFGSPGFETVFRRSGWPLGLAAPKLRNSR